MADKHIPVTEEELHTVEATATACPDLDPYMTDKGGVVIFNGPFPKPKAELATLFIKHAKLNLYRLVAEVRRLQRELAIKDALIGQPFPRTDRAVCSRCGNGQGLMINIPGETPG